jgi:hypothetical protein
VKKEITIIGMLDVISVGMLQTHIYTLFSKSDRVTKPGIQAKQYTP